MCSYRADCIFLAVAHVEATLQPTSMSYTLESSLHPECECRFAFFAIVNLIEDDGHVTSIQHSVT